MGTIGPSNGEVSRGREIPADRLLFMLGLQRFVRSHQDVKPSIHAAKGGQAEVLLNPDEQIPVAGYTDFRFRIPGEDSGDIFGGCNVSFIEDLPDDEQVHDFLFTIKPNGKISAAIIGAESDNPFMIEDLDQDETNWFINLVKEWMKLNSPGGQNVVPIRPPETELP